MIIDWMQSLPLWALLLWFFGGAIFYPLGIELAKNRNKMYYLGLSMIAIITTYTTMSFMTSDIQENTGVSIILILIIVVMVLLMFKFATPPVRSDEEQTNKTFPKRTIKTPPKPRPTSLKDIKEAVKKAPPKRTKAQSTVRSGKE